MHPTRDIVFFTGAGGLWEGYRVEKIDKPIVYDSDFL